MSALIPLIVLWLLVLVPSAIRSHAERRREFIGSFHRQLGALEASSTSSVATDRAAARPPTAVRPRTAAERRRTILVGLLLSMVVTLLPLFVFPGKLAIAVHLAVDNCFLLYVGLLVRWRDAVLSATGTRSYGPCPPLRSATGAALPVGTPAPPAWLPSADLPRFLQ
jgi:hypothetical protein